MMEDLSRRDALFVAAYVETGDAVEACKRAGLGPREANKTLARLQPAIDAAKASRATAEPTYDIRALDRAKAAYSIAERENNAAAMVSASQLIARLEGDLDGNTATERDPEQKTEPADPRDLARTIFSIMRPDPAMERAFLLALRAIDGGQLVVLQPPGQFVVTVNNPDLAKAMGGTLATPLDNGQQTEGE